MDKIKKLFKKLSLEERQDIIKVLSLLANNDVFGLNIKKVVGTNFWRVRSGRCRVLYKKENGENVVYEIRLRNEDTYKNL